MTHGYYRLSGYWRYFQIDPVGGQNAFEHGTDFQDVLDIYVNDAQLRNLLLEGLAEVEIALRTMLVAKLCVPEGDGTEYLSPATYSKAVNSDGRPHSSALLEDINSDLMRSKERHVLHYVRTDTHTVPLWVAVEALSFGSISRMYGLLADEAVQAVIASRFGYRNGLTAKQFQTNIRAVAVFRNVCAHHGRIWNREIRQDVPRIFRALVKPRMDEQHYRNTAWGVISVLTHMVNEVRGDSSFSQELANCVPSSGSYWDGLVSPSPK